MLILYNEEFMKLFFQEYARVYRQIINDVNRILKPYGLTSVLWRIFLYLEKHGTAKASHIYEYYSMDKGMTSRYIAKLRAGGFVEYIEQNGKIKKILQLTETGHQLFKEINVKIREHEKEPNLKFIRHLYYSTLYTLFEYTYTPSIIKKLVKAPIITVYCTE